MKKRLINRYEIDTGSADYFYDAESLDTYAECHGLFWFVGDPAECDGHPFTLTVTLDDEWVNFDDGAAGLGEERAERALTAVLCDEVDEIRANMTARWDY